MHPAHTHLSGPGRTLKEYTHAGDVQTAQQLIKDFLNDPVKKTTIREVSDKELQEILEDEERRNLLARQVAVLNFLSDEAKSPTLTLKLNNLEAASKADYNPVRGLSYNTQKRKQVLRDVENGYSTVKRLFEKGLISLGEDAPDSDYNTFVDRGLYEDMLEETDALIATLMDDNVIPLPEQLQAGFIHIQHNIETLLFGRSLEQNLALKDKYSVRNSVAQAVHLFDQYVGEYSIHFITAASMYYLINSLLEIHGYDTSDMITRLDYYYIMLMFCILAAGVTAGVKATDQYKQLQQNKKDELLTQGNNDSELFTNRGGIIEKMIPELKSTYSEDVLDIATLFIKDNDKKTLQKLLIKVAGVCKDDPILTQVLATLDTIQKVTTITPLAKPKDAQERAEDMFDNVEPGNEFKTSFAELCNLFAVIKKRYPDNWPTLEDMKSALSTEARLAGVASVGTAIILNS